MQLLINTTSPYARIASIALAEKQIRDVATDIVDPWTDPKHLLAANPAARVPTLVTDCGSALTESLLIVMWLEIQSPQPSLLGDDAVKTLSKTSVAMGIIDAAVHTLIGRKLTDENFDFSPVGSRRRRSMRDSLVKLEDDPPRYVEGTPDLAVISCVVALAYVRFRFPDADWLPDVPRLDELARLVERRPSFEISQPRM